jgi:hypothetical protein
MKTKRKAPPIRCVCGEKLPSWAAAMRHRDETGHKRFDVLYVEPQPEGDTDGV